MSQLSPLQFFLIPMAPDTAFTGRVASAPSDPYTTISYNTGVTGSFGAPLAGQTVHIGTTAGGRERGVLRLKTWSGGATGNITVNENKDVGPIIQANDYITIKNEFRLWPKYPRFLQSGPIVTIFEDFDIAYTNQTNQWRPVAVAGPPAIAFLAGGQAQASFVGDRSFALATGATITSYLWTARNSVEGASSSQGAEGSPVVFTWTTPGRHLVSLQVTDSNGQVITNYTWAIVIDPASPTDFAHLNFDTVSDSGDFNQGSGECSFAVRGGVTVADFPAEMMVVLAARGDITTPTGSWPFRTNNLFTGFVLSDTVRQNPDTGEVSFRAGTIDALMRNLTMFPVSLTDKKTPVNWTQGKNLTVDRTASLLWHFRSTLSLMGWISPSNYTGLIRRQDFGPTDMYSQLQNELLSSIWGKVVSNHQSVLHHTIDHNLRNASERATTTTRKTLHKGTWANDVTLEEINDYAQPVNQVKMSGIFYPGNEVDDLCPLFSESPGDAPRVYGKEANFDRLIILSQTDLNVRSGHALAKLTQRYPVFRMNFLNDGAFTIAPQELFPTIIEAGDNERGVSLSANLIPRRYSRSYDHGGGFFTIQVEFELETSGQAGVTVDMPCGPPEQKLPNTTAPAPPGGPPQLVAVASSNLGASFYFAPGLGQSWIRRIGGLADPEQLTFQEMNSDPWSTFKQGYNPDRVILWGCGMGFLVRSEDSGRQWQDRTPYLDDPPNAWSDATGTAAAALTIKQIESSIFNEDVHYVLAEAKNGANWRGWLAKTIDDGFNWTWYALTGAVQTRPLRMALDRGNGQSLWITTWENGTLYLRRHNPATAGLDLSNQFSLGSATETQVGAGSVVAYPFCRLAAANEVYVYGRMQQPQNYTGTVHVLKNANAGATGSYSVVENTWSTDVCGAFGADGDQNYYAVRQAP